MDELYPFSMPCGGDSECFACADYAYRYGRRFSDDAAAAECEYCEQENRAGNDPNVKGKIMKDFLLSEEAYYDLLAASTRNTGMRSMVLTTMK